MKSGIQTLFFAAALGVACSTLLVGVRQWTAPFVTINQQTDEVRQLLDALGIDIPEDADSAAVLSLFERSVKRVERGTLAYYECRQNGSDAIQSVAVRFSGPGVWGDIEGVVALTPDFVTIRRVRFIKQEETPGLGGEIASDAFLSRFVGKTLVAANGAAGFKIVKPGNASGPNAVDGITGATMTSARVGQMLDSLAQHIHEDNDG